jgi:hypothetical protein
MLTSPEIIDLSITKWYCKHASVEDAICELLMNALDADPNATFSSSGQGTLSVCDGGRGLELGHFVMGHDEEEVQREHGRFGIGLKDAIAVLFRKSSGLRIQSPGWEFTFTEKVGQLGKPTIHVVKKPCQHQHGTRIDVQVGAEFTAIHDRVRARFLKFAPELRAGPVFESGSVDIYASPTGKPLKHCFVNGVRKETIQSLRQVYNFKGDTKLEWSRDHGIAASRFKKLVADALLAQVGDLFLLFLLLSLRLSRLPRPVFLVPLARLLPRRALFLIRCHSFSFPVTQKAQRGETPLWYHRRPRVQLESGLWQVASPERRGSTGTGTGTGNGTNATGTGMGTGTSGGGSTGSTNSTGRAYGHHPPSRCCNSRTTASAAASHNPCHWITAGPYQPIHWPAQQRSRSA